MTTPAPRRTRDLLTFSAESDDEFSITPCKPGKTKDAGQINSRKLDYSDNGNKENMAQQDQRSKGDRQTSAVYSMV